MSQQETNPWVIITVVKENVNPNDLQNIANRREINPDAKLTSLLALEKSDKVDYFSLQKYMNKHFSKE